MTIAAILNEPWAIQPAYLEMLQQIYHDRKEQRLDPAGLREIEARIGKPLNNNADKPYQVMNGVAVIPVMGSIAKRGGMFSSVSGLTSYESIQSDLSLAADDPEVISAILNIDSPGGVVNGVATAAAAIDKFAQSKPIAAWSDGVMTSAAYWMGAATGNVYIGSETTELGSIGVVGGHTDISKQEEMRGVKTTILTAGKYKGVGHPYAPLPSEHQAVMQDRLDHTYTTFVNEMAQYRKVSPEKVHSDMADGKIFSGSKAIDAGLADGMMSFDDLLAMMRDKGRNKQSTMPSTQGSFVHTATGGETTQEEVQMTRAELNEKYPALFAEVFNEGQQAGVVTGASQERARIQSVLSIPGPLAAAHKDLVSQMAFDGKTSAEAAVYRLHTAAEEHRTTMAAAIQTGAVAPAPAAEAGEQSEEQKSVAMAVDHMVAGAAAYQSRQ